MTVAAVWQGVATHSALRARLQSVAFLLLALAVVAGFATQAAAAPRFAAIAVDARSGKVVFARDPDGVRYPASLTKIMTLYLLFREMKAGRFTADTRLPVSPYAAARAPSKIGLKPGETIRVEDAIRALCTKSANDVATIIAEALAGSEGAFAERMTRMARELGMSRTTFRNASGLPDPKQVTTARDMATLGLRIQRDFPEYYRYFSLRSFAYKGSTYRNHNGLLGRYDGLDGIKTGYIHASGFNLMAAAERDGRRLVAVVIGGKTAASRNRYMASLLDDMFKSARLKTNGPIAALAGDPPGLVKPAIATLAPPLPRPKPGLGTGVEQAAAEEAEAFSGEGSDSEESEAVAAGVASDTAGAAAVSALGPKEDMLVAKLASEDQAPRLAGEAVPVHSGWSIQIGAFPTKEGAEDRLVAAKASGIELIDGKTGFTMAISLDKGMLYRARFSGFTQDAARAACKALLGKGIACFPLSPEG